MYDWMRLLGSGFLWWGKSDEVEEGVGEADTREAEREAAILGSAVMMI